MKRVQHVCTALQIYTSVLVVKVEFDNSGYLKCSHTLPLRGWREQGCCPWCWTSFFTLTFPPARLEKERQRDCFVFPSCLLFYVGLNYSQGPLTSVPVCASSDSVITKYQELPHHFLICMQMEIPNGLSAFQGQEHTNMLQCYLSQSLHCHENRTNWLSHITISATQITSFLAMNIGAKGAASLMLTRECPFFSQNRRLLSIQNGVVTVYWLIMLQYFLMFPQKCLRRLILTA